LYQLHRIDPKVPAEKSFEFLQKAQASGKIKHIGLSEVSVIEIELARKFFNVVSVQNKYSIDNRSWEPVLEYCEQNNIAFIPWFPVGGGSVKDQEILRQMAERKNTSIHLLALSWLLHHSNIIILIPGTSSLSHLQENMKVADIQLSEEELKELDGLSTLS
jgi:aryl-alcohol dehydrogenase-like predicted oxidoreductase